MENIEKFEIPAFAEAPALRKASGGGALRRQAKQFQNSNFKILYQFSCLKSHSKIPPHLPCLPTGRLFQREEKYFPLLTKGDRGGLDGLFQSA
jgi:hypothetical protein